MFEVKTPLLKRAAAEMIGIFDGLKDGSMDRADAGRIIGAGNAVTRMVESELKVRLAAPKLARIEAQVVALAA